MRHSSSEGSREGQWKPAAGVASSLIIAMVVAAILLWGAMLILRRIL